MPSLKLQKLFPFQQASHDQPNKRKLYLWGRRSGKTRAVLRAAVTGHGPKVADANGNVVPMLRGMAQGGDVLWLGPDYTQLATIWREEIKPRFDEADGCHTNENEMTAWLGANRLILRTTENPRALRGMGAKAVGVIIDESAHLDLENLLKDVVLPILLDNDGWLILASTPNAGSDGHVTEDGSKRTPSYFNVIAEQIRAGTMPNWFMSHHDARDNPRISAAGFAELVAEYPVGSLKLEQEVYAKLIRGGAGFAFPEMDLKVHQQPTSPSTVTEVIAGCDWGWSSHGWIGALELNKRGAHLASEMPFNGPIPDEQRRDPERVGYDAGAQWLAEVRDGRLKAIPELVYCDSAMDAISQGGLSVMALLQVGFDRALGDRAPTCVAARKGSGSRHVRKSVLHILLRSKTIEAENGMKVMVEAPRLTISPRCPFWWKTVSGLMVDPKDVEDVDTKGPDHAYDGSTYALVEAFPDLIARGVAPVDPRMKTDRLSVLADRDYDEATDLTRLKRLSRPSAKVYG